jgi:hypothetical protein
MYARMKAKTKSAEGFGGFFVHDNGAPMLCNAPIKE